MSAPKIASADKIAVSPGEAAALLSIDRATFYRRIMPLVRAGTIRSLRVGKSQRIFVDSLRAWADSQVVTGLL
jgi:excisionase family DNA binding protein